MLPARPSTITDQADPNLPPLPILPDDRADLVLPPRPSVADVRGDAMASNSASTVDVDVTCPYCPRVFSSAHSRARHVKAIHRLSRRPSEDRLLSQVSGPSDARARSRVPQPPQVGSNTLLEHSTALDSQLPPLIDDAEVAVPCRRSPLPGSPRRLPPRPSDRSRAHDGMERGRVASPGHPPVCSNDGKSISARVWDFYQQFREANGSVLVVPPDRAVAPTLFDEPELRSVLRFIVSAGGSGLSQASQLQFAEAVLSLEATMTVPGGPRGLMTERFSSPFAFGAAVQTEHDRVLAKRKWRVANIFIGGVSYPVYFRDILEAGLDRLRTSKDVELEGTELPPTTNGDRCRSHTLNSDLFLEEQEDVRRTHGRHAHVLAVHLHSDEAVVAWNGGQLMYPVRVRFSNVRDDGGTWETVAHLPHIPKVVGNGRNARARLAVSDGRNDLLQRSLALALRGMVAASESGVEVSLPTAGRVFLVPRLLALVVDQVEERSLLALMGSQCLYNCTHCLTERDIACSDAGGMAPPRPVISTLEAQLAAATARLEDGRPRTRVALGRATSALPFAPVLGALHGLGTGRESLYRIVSFDTLHVWKLGVLRLLTQRLPAMLAAACPDGEAVLGTVQETTDVVNWRCFELGRLCRASPTTPGYESFSAWSASKHVAQRVVRYAQPLLRRWRLD